MIAPEEYDGCDCYGGHEEIGAAIISCCDATPVLQAVEGVFDLMSLFINGLVELDRCFAAGDGRDAGRDVHRLESAAPFVAVIPLVGDQRLGLRQGRIDDLGPDMV